MRQDSDTFLMDSIVATMCDPRPVGRMQHRTLSHSKEFSLCSSWLWIWKSNLTFHAGSRLPSTSTPDCDLERKPLLVVTDICALSSSHQGTIVNRLLRYCSLSVQAMRCLRHAPGHSGRENRYSAPHVVGKLETVENALDTCAGRLSKVKCCQSNRWPR